MKDLLVICRDGPMINQTLATISFEKHGSKTKQDLIVCPSWDEAFAVARQSESMLFVDHGTVFTDWPQWIASMSTYPHRGLIGHIVWNNSIDEYPRLHPQCWYMDADLVNSIEWGTTHLSSPVPIRSEKNIHDDYTPLYLKPSSKTNCQFTVQHFSQLMIAAQLSRGLPVVNWHNKMRDLKHYNYSENTVQHRVWQDVQEEYCKLAEGQFWILNNEPITVQPGKRHLSLAAGLHWIVNISSTESREMDIVDISITQVEFARHLWESWDGLDYGQQVIEFIKNKKLIHFEIDLVNLDPVSRLKFRNMSHLKKYVNEKFDDLVPDDFVQRWQHARNTKKVRFQIGNLVDWVIQNGVNDIDSIWISNILDYKWTMLKSNTQDIKKFKEILHGSTADSNTI